MQICISGMNIYAIVNEAHCFHNPVHRNAFAFSQPTLRTLTMQRRNFLRIIGGGTVAAAGLGAAAWLSLPTAMPAAATAAWAGPDEGVRTGGDIRLVLLSYALLAPHAHNLQSWSVDLSQPDSVRLYCDLARLLPHTDPYSRQIMISHGAFLEVLDLAAGAHGLRTEVTLFPEGVFDPGSIDARPVANVRLHKDPSIAPDPLFAQVQHRHTHRGAYDASRAIAPDVLDTLRTATGPAAALGFAGSAESDVFTPLIGIALEAWRVELTTPRTVMESIALLRVGTAEVAQHRDGISLLAPFPVAMDRLGMMDRTAPPVGPSLSAQIDGFNASLDSTPGMLWLSTPSNDRASQIAAGRAYVRTQLAATSLGLSFHPLSQALQEYPEQAALYDKVHVLTGARAAGATVQMWVRVGYANAIGPSPRRGLHALIRT
jgi:hypothetical protein